MLLEAKADVNAKNNMYDPPLHARLKMGAQVLFYFGRFNSLVLVVDGLRSNVPSSRIKARLPRICAASERASCASSNGHVEVCRLLIDAKADLGLGGMG